MEPTTEAERRRQTIDELLPKALEVIIETPAAALERRGRFLAHLLARFSEDLRMYELLMEDVLGDDASARVTEDKRLLLEDYPAASAERSRACDYRFPDTSSTVEGYIRRIYRLLGIRDLTRRHLAGHAFQVVGSGTAWRFVLKNGNGVTLFESRECTSPALIEALLDDALGLGGDPDNYAEPEGGGDLQLVVRCADDDVRVIGTAIGVTTVDGLDSILAYFAQYGESEGFHLVEHVLLRKRTTGDPYLPLQISTADTCDCPDVSEPYSFRATIVLPSWPTRYQDLKFRRFVEETLRREAPAHVLLKICWVGHMQMKSFEIAYDEWRRRLAELLEDSCQCRTEQTPIEQWALTGEMPLPETASDPGRIAYGTALKALIERMHSLVTVYPRARLHDCETTSGDTPQVTLNNTSLGTL